MNLFSIKVHRYTGGGGGKGVTLKLLPDKMYGNGELFNVQFTISIDI